MNVAAQKIRIAIFIDALTRSGTELQVQGLIHSLKQDAEILLVTFKPSDPALIPNNCRHIYFPLQKIGAVAGLKTLLAIRQLLRREQIQIVQCYFQDATIMGLVAATLARTPHKIACFRDLGFWLKPSQSYFYTRLYRLADRYLCNAEQVKQHFCKTFSLDAAKASVIYNGIDIDTIKFRPPSPITDIGIVGNMTRRVKRIDLFIAAAAQVSAIYPDLRFHILGDGNLKSELEAQARELGILDKLIFTGRIDHVINYLSKLDIGVICSDSEGLSNAIIEYMLAGCTVVATDVGGNPELIRDQHTGLLIPPDNADALAQAIIQLIESPEKRSHMTLAARAHAESQFSWEQSRAAHLAVYHSLLKTNTAERH